LELAINAAGRFVSVAFKVCAVEIPSGPRPPATSGSSPTAVPPVTTIRATATKTIAHRIGALARIRYLRAVRVDIGRRTRSLRRDYGCPPRHLRAPGEQALAGG